METKQNFWKNGWVNQTSLKDLFPDLLLICENPEDRVCDCWIEQGWNISFRRMINVWEIERVAALLGTLGEISIPQQLQTGSYGNSARMGFSESKVHITADYMR